MSKNFKYLTNDVIPKPTSFVFIRSMFEYRFKFISYIFICLLFNRQVGHSIEKCCSKLLAFLDSWQMLHYCITIRQRLDANNMGSLITWTNNLFFNITNRRISINSRVINSTLSYFINSVLAKHMPSRERKRFSTKLIVFISSNASVENRVFHF